MPHPPAIDYQKKADQLLGISFKRLLHALPQYVFIKDVHSVYLACNTRYAQLLGLSSPEEIVGKTDLEINWQPSGHTADVFRKGDQDTLQGHPLTNQEETLVLPNGKKLITLVSKLPIVDEHHEILGIVGYFSDITVLKEQECELKQAKQQAEAANRAKSLFITNISHDIRTPLAGIIGAAQLMAQTATTQENREITTGLIHAAEGLLQFLNEVIEFSKWESGNLPIYEVKFSLRELIDHLLGLVRVAAQEKHLNFQVHLDNQLPTYWIGDSVRLQRILLNLVNNAIKFTEQGSVDLTISLARKQRRKHVLQIVVQDTGVGIPLAQQPLIFTRFNRLHPAYEGRYTGAGLGLALVKRMIDELGGEIYVASAENQGTTFTCLIPLRLALLPDAQHVSHPPPLKQPADASMIANTRQLAASQPLHRPTFLLVEDHPLVQRAIKSQLETLEVVVDTADQGSQALLKIQSVDYAFIIMDLGLPDQDGCSVTEAIHTWQRTHGRPLSPVVALSAHLDEVQHQRCLAVGMIAAFTKPLDEAKLKRLADLFQTCSLEKRNTI